MFSQSNNQDLLDEILMEFHLQSDRPAPAILRAFIRRYPQYERELTEFAVEWAKLDSVPEGAEANKPVNENLVSRVMSNLQNTLYHLDKEEEQQARHGGDQEANANHGQASQGDLFKSLDFKKCQELAAHMSLDIPMLNKVVDRQFDPNSFKPGFLKRMADWLTAPLSTLVRDLCNPREVTEGKNYRAVEKPRSPPQQDFSDAVCNSGLPEQSKRRLLNDDWS